MKNKFKVGDWVVSDSYGIGCIESICNEVKNPYQVQHFPGKDVYDISELRVWVPSTGDLVWFWDDCTPHRPTLRQFGYIDFENYDIPTFCDSEQNPFTNIEPFLNKPPTFFDNLK